MEYEFRVDGKPYRFSLAQGAGKVVATVNGNLYEADVVRISAHVVSLLIAGRSYLARTIRDKGKIHVAIGSSRFCLEESRPGSTQSILQEGMQQKLETTIKSPMPGMVIKVTVSAGDAVKPGDTLAVVEAMKMEHDMRASFEATVEEVFVHAGQQVDAFQPLVKLKPGGNVA